MGKRRDVRRFRYDDRMCIIQGKQNQAKLKFAFLVHVEVGCVGTGRFPVQFCYLGGQQIIVLHLVYGMM